MMWVTVCTMRSVLGGGAPRLISQHGFKDPGKNAPLILALTKKLPPRVQELGVPLKEEDCLCGRKQA